MQGQISSLLKSLKEEITSMRKASPLGRAKFNQEFKTRAISIFESSGMSKKEFCDKTTLNYGNFSAWKIHGKSPGFSEVLIKPKHSDLCLISPQG